MTQLPTGTVTFLFTDIEGSTQLLQRLGEEYAEALGQSQALLRAAFAAHGGVEVDTQGDAFFVAFAAAPQAVAAAAEATRALAAHAWPAGATLRVRMGLHTGTPQLVGDHYVGLDVHRAARIAAAGHGGQILLSAATRILAEHALPDGATLRDLGAHRLKDLQEPEPIVQLVLPDPGLPADFPPLKTLDTSQHNLPLQPTPLLGREAQMAALTALLRRPDVRLVTLTGPGGIGKTRLAVQVAADVLDVFPDGVWFVRLSRLSDPELVIPTIAQSLGLKEAGSQPLAELLRAHLAERRLLLVLDNFEQVVGAASAVAGLLAASPGLRALVTSRTPLRLRGEHEYALGPLPLPAPGAGLQAPDQLAQYAAVALFIERAQAARADFSVTAANAPAIAEICARLDGLPLAIELAAVRVKLLPPEALLARLSSQLKLLTGGARDLEARQQTMRATIAWSEQLLTPAQRVLFRRLAVFTGGATLEAVETVCLTPDGVEPLDLDALDGLSAMVDQSLVQQREEGGEPRFGMLQVIREYALEQLDASGEAEALRQAHAGYFLTFVERGRRQFTGPGYFDITVHMERELDNLRAALRWSLDSCASETAARMGVALGLYWEADGYWTEGQQWLAQALDLRDIAPHLQAELLWWCGHFERYQGNFATAEPRFQEAFALYRASEEKNGAGLALIELGLCAQARDDLEETQRLTDEGLAMVSEFGDQRTISLAYLYKASLMLALADYQAAKQCTQQARAMALAAGDPRGVAACDTELIRFMIFDGAYDKADAALLPALETSQRLKDKNILADVYEDIGLLALERGDLEQARTALETSIALRAEIGRAPAVADIQLTLAEARLASGDLVGAEDACLSSLRAARRFGRRGRIQSGLETLAHIAWASGQAQRAARLLGAATALDDPRAQLRLPRLDAQHARAAAEVRETLGEATFEAAYTEGATLTAEQAIAEALNDSDDAGDGEGDDGQPSSL
jgi:predicted ATPase/class 3 adenylate cyclase